MTNPKNAWPQLASELDQDWAEAVDWFGGSVWTPEELERFTNLLACDTEELRQQATEQELDCIQRLGRVAFYECWKRTLEAVAIERQIEGN